MFVYLLSHYGEYGSQNVKATLERAHLPSMLDRMLAEQFKNLVGDAARAGLTKLLQQSDEDLASEDASIGDDQLIGRVGQSPHDLTDGWGGVQLHVVKLEEPR